MRSTSPFAADALGTFRMMERLANDLTRIVIDDLDGAAAEADDLDALRDDALAAIDTLCAWRVALRIAALRREDATG